jgi:serine protease Do
LRPPAREGPQSAAAYYGTGIVVDRRGLVLTNYHVLGFDNDDYQVDHYVTTSDRKTYRARIKAADPRSDLAVLELIAPNAAGQATELDLEPMPLGDGQAVRKGSLVITLGNPYALGIDGQASAGWGMVANLERKASGDANEESAPGGKTTLHHYGTLIQVDARLNLGASGGALLNLQGEMIGLTTAMAAQTGYESAAGFAIPVNEVFLRALEALKEGREVEYGFLGAQPAQTEIGQNRPAGEAHGGVRVERVVRGGPGDRAGLRRDDVITAVERRPVFDADSLVLAVGQFAPERRVKLSVLRDGQPRELLAELTKAHRAAHQIVTRRLPAWRGLRVDFPTALLSQRELFDLPPEGVAVEAVESGSAAAKAGISPGMLLISVGKETIRSPAAFRRAVARREGAVELLVRSPVGEERAITVAE